MVQPYQSKSEQKTAKIHLDGSRQEPNIWHFENFTGGGKNCFIFIRYDCL